jgi:hypothetical protein
MKKNKKERNSKKKKKINRPVGYILHFFSLCWLNDLVSVSIFI